MYEHLKSLRESLGMTQEEFGKSVGVAKSTYNNYETGIRDPKSDFWIAVAEKYGVTIDYLMGFSNDPHRTSSGKKITPLFSSEVMQVARDYNDLDHWGQQVVRSVIADEKERCEDEKNFRLEFQEQQPAPKVIPLFLSAPAAGIAAPIMGEDYVDYTLKDDDPPAAMFSVKVDGDSMEPDFPDGSMVFCNKDPLQNGDIGVFAVDGESVIKQYYYDRLMGITYLFSLNRKRADADITLTRSSGQTVTCLGRVITKRRYKLPGISF